MYILSENIYFCSSLIRYHHNVALLSNELIFSVLHAILVHWCCRNHDAHWHLIMPDIESDFVTSDTLRFIKRNRYWL